MNCLRERHVEGSVCVCIGYVWPCLVTIPKKGGVCERKTCEGNLSLVGGHGGNCFQTCANVCVKRQKNDQGQEDVEGTKSETDNVPGEGTECLHPTYWLYRKM